MLTILAGSLSFLAARSCSSVKDMYQSNNCCDPTVTSFQFDTAGAFCATPPPPPVPPSLIQFNPLLFTQQSESTLTANSTFTALSNLEYEDRNLNQRTRVPPLVVDDKIIFVASDAGGRKANGVVAVDRQDDSVVWSISGVQELERLERDSLAPYDASKYHSIPTPAPGDTISLRTYPVVNPLSQVPGTFAYAFTADDDILLIQAYLGVVYPLYRIPGTLVYVTTGGFHEDFDTPPGWGAFSYNTYGVQLVYEKTIEGAATGVVIDTASGLVANYVVTNAWTPDARIGTVSDDMQTGTVPEDFDPAATPSMTTSPFPPIDGSRFMARSMHAFDGGNRLLLTTQSNDFDFGAITVVDAHTGEQAAGRVFHEYEGMSPMGLGVVQVDGVDHAVVGLAQTSYHDSTLKGYRYNFGGLTNRNGKVLLVNLQTMAIVWTFETNPKPFLQGDLLPAEAFAASQDRIVVPLPLTDGLAFTSDSAGGTRATNVSPDTRLIAASATLAAGTTIPPGSFYHANGMTLTSVANSSVTITLVDSGDAVTLTDDMTTTFEAQRFSMEFTNAEGVFNASETYTGVDESGRWFASRGDVFVDGTIAFDGEPNPIFQSVMTTYSKDMAGVHAFATSEEAAEFNFWGAGVWQNGEVELVKTAAHPDGLIVLAGGGGTIVPQFIVQRHSKKMDVWSAEFIRVQIGSYLQGDIAASQARLRTVIASHKAACESDPRHMSQIYDYPLRGTTQRTYIAQFEAFADLSAPTIEDMHVALELAQQYALFCHELGSLPQFMSPMERRSMQGAVFALDVRTGALVLSERLYAPDAFFQPGREMMQINVTKMTNYKDLWVEGSQTWTRAHIEDAGYNGDSNLVPITYRENGKSMVVSLNKMQVVDKLEIVDVQQLEGVTERGIAQVRYRQPVERTYVGHMVPTYNQGGVGGTWLPTLHQGKLYTATTHYSPVPFRLNDQTFDPFVSWVAALNLDTMTVDWSTAIPRMAHQPSAQVTNGLVVTTDAFGTIHMYDAATGAYVHALSDGVDYNSGSNPPLILGSKIYWKLAKGWSDPAVLDPPPPGYPNDLIANATDPSDIGILRWTIG